MKEVNYKVTVDTKGAQKGVKDLNKEIDNTSKKSKQAEGSLDGVTNVADRATGGMISGFTGALKSIKAVNLGFKSMKFAIVSTGIGALVVVLASLAAAFASSEQGQDKFNKLTTIMGALVGNLVDKLADLGEALIEAFEQPEVALEKLGELIKNNLLNRLNGIITLLPAIADALTLVFEGEFTKAAKVAADQAGQVLWGVESVTDAFGDAKDAVGEFIDEQVKEMGLAAKVADMRAKADKIERKLLVKRSKLESEIALLRLKSRQEDEFSAQERKDALLEAQALEDELLDAQTKALKLRSKAQTLENTFSRSNKENLDKEAQAQAAVNRQVAARANNARQLQRELNRVNAEIERDAKAIDAAEQKLIDEKIKKEDELFKFLSEVQADAKQKEINSLVAKYDKAYELAVNNAEKEKQLKEQQKLDVAAIDEKYRLLKIDADKKAADENAAAIKKEQDDYKNLQDKKRQMATDALSAIGQLVTAFAGENEAAQKKAFKVNKAISIAQAIINTAGAISAAINPAVGGLGIPAGLPGAALAGITGAAQVATIAATQFQSSGSSSPSAPSSSSLGGVSESQAPAFNVVGQSGFNQVATALGQSNSTPIKTYVVSGDVTTAQALDNNIIDTATF
jgi:hypothetical protein